MQINDDELVRRRLQDLADEPAVPEIPTSAQAWSQIQFRLRYQGKGRRRSYMTTMAQVTVAIWTLFVVIELNGISPSTLGIVAVLIAATVAALFLYLLTYRAIRS
jgi:hypothetical protein